MLAPALGRHDLDIVTLNDAPPLLARHVLRSGRRVFCEDEALIRTFVRTTFERLPGFRNVVVHEYAVLDKARVVAALRDLEPIEAFLEVVRTIELAEGGP